LEAARHGARREGLRQRGAAQAGACRAAGGGRLPRRDPRAARLDERRRPRARARRPARPRLRREPGARPRHAPAGGAQGGALRGFRAAGRPGGAAEAGGDVPRGDGLRLRRGAVAAGAGRARDRARRRRPARGRVELQAGRGLGARAPGSPQHLRLPGDGLARPGVPQRERAGAGPGWARGGRELTARRGSHRKAAAPRWEGGPRRRARADSSRGSATLPPVARAADVPLEAAPLEWEASLWQAAIAQLVQTLPHARIDAGVAERLSHPEHAVLVSVPIRLDSGETRVFTAYRVQHSRVLGPTKGGVRYDPRVSLGECAALAMWMTWKCALLRL